MSIYIQAFSELGNVPVELFWIAGLNQGAHGTWSVNAVLRELPRERYHQVRLPLGLLPYLALGTVYCHGKPLELRDRGVLGEAVIENTAAGAEVTSAAIPEALYSFGAHRSGVQRLFRYATADGELFIPAIELVRYLFVHNRTLAHALMRPGGLNLLFHPEAPGYQSERTLRFTREMPRNLINRRFAEEFAWLAFDPEARRAWDSVYRRSRDQRYVTLDPPALKHSRWRFRGVRQGRTWLVMELLHLSGRKPPCRKLLFRHPLDKVERHRQKGGAITVQPGAEGNGLGEVTQTKLAYVIDDGRGPGMQRHPGIIRGKSKIGGFDSPLVVQRLKFTDDTDTEMQPRVEVAPRSTQLTKVRTGRIKTKKEKVAVGEPVSAGRRKSVDFQLLSPADWDSRGDLDVLVQVLDRVTAKRPDIDCAMSVFQLEGRRTFARIGCMPRPALVASLRLEHGSQTLLLDVERTGVPALSLIALHVEPGIESDVLDAAVKQTFDDLVSAGGHWPAKLEENLKGTGRCERLPKLPAPRENIKVPGQVDVWAMRLIQRLGL